MATEALARDPNNRRAAAVLEALPKEEEELNPSGPRLYGFIETGMTSSELAKLIECSAFAEVYLGKSLTFDGIHVDLGAGGDITLEKESGGFGVGGEADAPATLSKAAAVLTDSLSKSRIRHYLNVFCCDPDEDGWRSHYNWPDEEEADNTGAEPPDDD